MSDAYPALDVLVVYVPHESTPAVLSALFGAGAGAVGDYEECAFVAPGRGQYRPVRGANPSVGTVGELTTLDEDRVEVTFPRDLRTAVVTALRAAHPYEEPAFHVIATADLSPR